jgi:hypothetical protein
MPGAPPEAGDFPTAAVPLKEKACLPIDPAAEFRNRPQSENGVPSLCTSGSQPSDDAAAGRSFNIFRGLYLTQWVAENAPFGSLSHQFPGRSEKPDIALRVVMEHGTRRDIR